jgi:hypothetical protein
VSENPLLELRGKPVVLLLSGGLDSTLVGAAAAGPARFPLPSAAAIPLLALLPPELYIVWFLKQSPSREAGWDLAMRLDTQLLSIASSLYCAMEGGYIVGFKVFEYIFGPDTWDMD